jgi:hypothetical protein
LEAFRFGNGNAGRALGDSIVVLPNFSPWQRGTASPPSALSASVPQYYIGNAGTLHAAVENHGMNQNGRMAMSKLEHSKLSPHADHTQIGIL